MQEQIAELERFDARGERAMARAFARAGRVEVVHGESAKKLAVHEGMGAILRFSNPAKVGTL